MADVNSDIHQPTGTYPRELVSTQRKKGRVRTFSGKLTLPATVAAGDKGFLGELPSTARILPESTIYYSTGLTGLDDVDLGDANDPDGLVDGEDMSSAGSCAAIKKLAIGDYGKQLWEMLGYTSDPGSELLLYLTFVAELTGSGTIFFDIRYVVD